MELATLILADHCDAVNGKLYINGGGWNTLTLPELPVPYGFAIGITIDVDWNETNRRHDLELHVEGPDGEHLGDAPLSAQFEQGRPPGTPPGTDQRMVLAVGTQQTFESAGPHAVVVSVDGEELGRARFYVAAAAAALRAA